MTRSKKKKELPSGQHKKYTCVDLFAGAGGFSLAAISAGMEVVAAIENDKAASQTYKSNICKAQKSAVDFYDRDILQIDPEKLAGHPRIKDSGCDLVLGGPPCQGFSVHRIRGAGVDDDRNKLILKYFEFVSRLRPKLFLMENVPGILWERHESYLNEFYREGAKAGYTIFPPEVLDARNFGIPQRRKRVFILGVRSDVYESDHLELEWPPRPTHGDDAAIESDRKLRPWVSAADVFLRPIDEGDINNVHMQHNQELIEVFKSTPANGGSRHESIRVLPCHKNHNGHRDVYGRINPSQPGPTMTTACVNPSKGRFLHPTQHHGITVRHAARFQTFPDWFTFHGGLMAAARQVGNAVPVQFGAVLINGIKKALDKYNSSHEND